MGTVDHQAKMKMLFVLALAASAAATSEAEAEPSYGYGYGIGYGGHGLSYRSYGRSRGGLLTDVAMATATEAMATPPEATADPIQSPVATDPTAAMALLTAATTTERRQHQTSIRILINMNWTK